MKNKKDDKPHYLPTFMSIGISIGAAIGVVTNNIPLYMLVGLALGVGIGSALDGQIEIGKVMNLKRITKNNQPTKFPFVVTSEAGFGAGTHKSTSKTRERCRSAVPDGQEIFKN